jgi:hypothetical protein
MLIDERQMTRFPARRTFKKIWIMIAGFGVFIAIGLALYFGTGERTALLAVAFGGVFTLALIIVFVAPPSFRSASGGSSWIQRIIGSRSQGESVGENTEAAMETGWVDGDTFRTRITARSEISATADDEEKSRVRKSRRSRSSSISPPPVFGKRLILCWKEP